MISKLSKSALVGFLAIGLLVSPVAAGPAHAQSTASLEAQIQALLAQVAALQAQLAVGSTTTAPFTRDLTIGSTGPDVTRLQQFLIARGHAIPAGATGYFGTQTRAAVAAYQAANGIAPVAGYFGPLTRARVNTQLGTATPPPTQTPDDDDELEGGAGSIDDADFISSLNNEEVGEDEEDSEIAGLEIQPDDGSDIEITAVTINFDQGSADEDFEDYAEEVSIWLDGEEFARVDAEEFEDDDFEQTISLDDGAIIRRGETGELVVAVTGLGNIDSADVGDTWTVEFESVRFRDAQGATVTDSTSGDIDGATRSFSFESFSTAADAELHISGGDDEINDSRSITVDESDESDDEAIFSFNVEVEGDSDLNVDEIVVDFDFTGTATTLDDIFSGICLEMDGDEVGCESVPSDDSVTFEDLDLDLSSGEEVEFTVVADVLDLDSNTFDEGDTVTARITSTERDAWVVEDESGEDLSDNDKTGTASTESISFFESGLMVEAVSTEADTNDAETVGTFEIVVDVTAFGDDQYVHEGAANASSTDAGFYYTVYRNGTAYTSVTFGDLVTSTADEDGEYLVIDEGETERFTLTVTVNPDDAGLFTVELDSLRFDPDNDADATSEEDTWYTVPSSEDVETPAESLVAA